MIVVPPGSFTMSRKPPYDGRLDDDPEGVSKSAPARSVTIEKAFAMGIYDVTREEYSVFVRQTHWSSKDTCYTWNGDQWIDDKKKDWRDPGFRQTPRDPVVCVSWEDAQAYVRWLNSQVSPPSVAGEHSSDPYRLPSWEESEYAAGAGATSTYPWGEQPRRDQANYGTDECFPCRPARQGADRWRYTSPVGSFPPNAFGLYDMAGNVWQWTQDCLVRSPSGFRGVVQGAPATCGASPLRGGSWLASPEYMRVGAYTINSRINHNHTIGFRVARVLE
jgi:formylglycine-generating enzyme required for sulfatase activity